MRRKTDDLSKKLRVDGGVEERAKQARSAFRRIPSGSAVVYKIEGGWEKLRTKDGKEKQTICRSIVEGLRIEERWNSGASACFDFTV